MIQHRKILGFGPGHRRAHARAANSTWVVCCISSRESSGEIVNFGPLSRIWSAVEDTSTSPIMPTRSDGDWVDWRSLVAVEAGFLTDRFNHSVRRLVNKHKRVLESTG